METNVKQFVDKETRIETSLKLADLCYEIKKIYKEFHDTDSKQAAITTEAYVVDLLEDIKKIKYSNKDLVIE